MFHLIHDPSENDYLLLETEGPNTTYVYRAPGTEQCWLSLAEIRTAVQTCDESPENFHLWKAKSKFNFMESSPAISGIFEFINNHPELCI